MKDREFIEEVIRNIGVSETEDRGEPGYQEEMAELRARLRELGESLSLPSMFACRDCGRLHATRMLGVGEKVYACGAQGVVMKTTAMKYMGCSNKESYRHREGLTSAEQPV